MQTLKESRLFVLLHATPQADRPGCSRIPVALQLCGNLETTTLQEMMHLNCLKNWQGLQMKGFRLETDSTQEKKVYIWNHLDMFCKPLGPQNKEI